MTDRPRFRGAVTTAAVCALALLAAACGGSNSNNSSESGGGDNASQTSDITVKPTSDTPKTGGTLSYGLEAEPDVLNPTAGKWAISAFMVANAVYDPLAALDANGVPKPYLLESFEHNADFTQWTLKSRQGVKFHDGTVADSSYGARLSRGLQNAPLTKAAVVYFKSVETPDPDTTVITMTKPWATFPFSLTSQGGYLPKFSDDKGTMDVTAPIGTGPFKWKGKTGSTIVLERNPDYWLRDQNGQQLPYLDGVRFEPIADSQSRQNSLLSGDLNVIHTSSNELQADLLKSAQDGKIQYFEDRGSKEKGFVMFNAASTAVKDPELRRALAYATDAKTYRSIQNIPEDLAATALYPPGSPWYTETPDFPLYDPGQAQQLIDAWKAKNGGKAPTIKLSTTPDPTNARAASILKDQWGQVGVDVTIDQQEQVTLITNIATANYDAVLWRQFGSSDPDSDWYFWKGDNANGVGGGISLNFAQYKNADVDKALDAGRATDDQAARQQQYAIVQTAWAKDVPYLWLSQTRWVVAADNKVRGVTNNPLPDGTAAQPFQVGSHRLTATWLDS